MELVYLLKPVNPKTPVEPVVFRNYEDAVWSLRITSGGRAPTTIIHDITGQSLLILETGEWFLIEAIRCLSAPRSL